MSKAEKFISDFTRNDSNEYFTRGLDGLGGYTTCKNFTPWLTPDQARKAAKIAREEVAEKACEFVDGLIELLNDHGHGLKKERILDELKQVMKDLK